MFNPDINDYQLTSIVAECCGGVAVVYSAVYKPYNQNVAIKRYFVDKDKEKASLIQVIIKQAFSNVMYCFLKKIIYKIREKQFLTCI